jgi:hypothetical protein
VVPCGKVKEPLRVPFLLLFILLCALVALSALDLLAWWGAVASGTGRFTLAFAAARLPRSVFQAMIPSVLLSLVLIGMRMARRPFSRLLGLILCLAVSYAALVNGMIWMRQLASRSKPVQASAAQYFPQGAFAAVGDAMVSARSVQGDTLRGVVVARPAGSSTPGAGNRSARLAAAPKAAATVTTSTVTVTVPGRPALAGRPSMTREAVFAPDVVTGYFLRDLGAITADFERLLASSLPEFFAACAALLFLCTASFVLLRVSRWPMLNVLLLVLAVRGYAALWRLLSAEAAPRIARLVTDPLLARMFPAAAMAALGVVLLLVDILFVPADRWKRLEES